MPWLALAITLGGLTRPPELLAQPDAVYPADAADAGVQGTVILEIDIGPDGKVMDARVTGQSGTPSLDQSALEAVRHFVFSPAEIDGAPAAVRIEYAYHFELRPVAVAEPISDAGSVPATINFAGTLKAMGTRELIPGALISAVYLSAPRGPECGSAPDRRCAGDFEATTGEDGRFELAGMPPGALHVAVTAQGFNKLEVDEVIKEGERTEVTYYLHPLSAAPETVVRGERVREASQVKLTRAEARYVAGTGGDAFRVLQNLPGVARSPFNTGFLVIRGSKAWDSRIYIDEVQIPQLFHFGGFNSTINSNLVESLALQPGNFSATFGRSIGGLVRAELKTPSLTGTHGFIDVSPFDAQVMVETPITDQWSLAAAGRRGLIDLTLPWALNTFAPAVAGAVGFSVSPVYWDYQLRAERRGEGGNRLFIQLFGSSDSWVFTRPIPFLDPDSEGNQGSFGTSVMYNRLMLGVDHRLGPRVKLVSRNSVGLDRYVLSGSTTDIVYRVDQYPVQLRERLLVDIPEAKLVVTTGLDLLTVPMRVDATSPPPFKPNQIPDPYVERRLVAENATYVHVEPGLFVEASWRPIRSLELVGSLRGDYQSYMNRAWADPRLSVFWTPHERFTLKGAAGIYHQPPDYRSGQLSPVFGNPKLKPEGARHYMIGTEVKITEALGLDVQGYYKDLFDQARLTLASGIGSDVNIPGSKATYTSDGYGRAYGMELLLRHKLAHNFFGWVSYSLSRFERDYYGGVIYAPGPLDQPHNLIAVATYRLPFDFVFGARLRWASGPLVTPIVASLYDTNGNYYYPLPGLPWSQRLPDFFSLDLRLDKRFVFKSFVLAVYVDVQNVTNRQNVEGVFYNFDYSEKQFVYGVPILPALGLRAEF